MKVFTLAVNGIDYEIRPTEVIDDSYGDEIVLFHTDLPFEQNYQFETTISRNDFEEYDEGDGTIGGILALLLWDEINSFFETEQSE